MPPAPRKQVTFACPQDVLEEMDAFCASNRLDRTDYIHMAVQKLVQFMAEEAPALLRPKGRSTSYSQEAEQVLMLAEEEPAPWDEEA